MAGGQSWCTKVYNFSMCLKWSEYIYVHIEMILNYIYLGKENSSLRRNKFQISFRYDLDIVRKEKKHTYYFQDRTDKFVVSLKLKHWFCKVGPKNLIGM